MANKLFQAAKIRSRSDFPKMGVIRSIYKSGLGFLFWGPEVPFLVLQKLQILRKICDFEDTRNGTSGPRNENQRPLL